MLPSPARSQQGAITGEPVWVSRGSGNASAASCAHHRNNASKVASTLLGGEFAVLVETWWMPTTDEPSCCSDPREWQMSMYSNAATVFAATAPGRGATLPGQGNGPPPSPGEDWEVFASPFVSHQAFLTADYTGSSVVSAAFLALKSATPDGGVETAAYRGSPVGMISGATAHPGFVNRPQQMLTLLLTNGTQLGLTRPDDISRVTPPPGSHPFSAVGGLILPGQEWGTAGERRAVADQLQQTAFLWNGRPSALSCGIRGTVKGTDYMVPWQTYRVGEPNRPAAAFCLGGHNTTCDTALSACAAAGNLSTIDASNATVLARLRPFLAGSTVSRTRHPRLRPSWQSGRLLLHAVTKPCGACGHGAAALRSGPAGDVAAPVSAGGPPGCDLAACRRAIAEAVQRRAPAAGTAPPPGLLASLRAADGGAHAFYACGSTPPDGFTSGRHSCVPLCLDPSRVPWLALPSDRGSTATALRTTGTRSWLMAWDGPRADARGRPGRAWCADPAQVLASAAASLLRWPDGSAVPASAVGPLASPLLASASVTVVLSVPSTKTRLATRPRFLAEAATDAALASGAPPGSCVTAECESCPVPGNTSVWAQSSSLSAGTGAPLPGSYASPVRLRLRFRFPALGTGGCDPQEGAGAVSRWVVDASRAGEPPVAFTGPGSNASWAGDHPAAAAAAAAAGYVVVGGPSSSPALLALALWSYAEGGAHPYRLGGRWLVHAVGPVGGEGAPAGAVGAGAVTVSLRCADGQDGAGGGGGCPVPAPAAWSAFAQCSALLVPVVLAAAFAAMGRGGGAAPDHRLPGSGDSAPLPSAPIPPRAGSSGSGRATLSGQSAAQSRGRDLTKPPAEPQGAAAAGASQGGETGHGPRRTAFCRLCLGACRLSRAVSAVALRALIVGFAGSAVPLTGLSTALPIIASLASLIAAGAFARGHLGERRSRAARGDPQALLRQSLIDPWTGRASTVDSSGGGSVLLAPAPHEAAAPGPRDSLLSLPLVWRFLVPVCGVGDAVAAVSAVRDLRAAISRAAGVRQGPAVRPPVPALLLPDVAVARPAVELVMTSSGCESRDAWDGFAVTVDVGTPRRAGLTPGMCLPHEEGPLRPQPRQGLVTLEAVTTPSPPLPGPAAPPALIRGRASKGGAAPARPGENATPRCTVTGGAFNRSGGGGTPRPAGRPGLGTGDPQAWRVGLPALPAEGPTGSSPVSGSVPGQRRQRLDPRGVGAGEEPTRLPSRAAVDDAGDLPVVLSAYEVDATAGEEVVRGGGARWSGGGGSSGGRWAALGPATSGATEDDGRRYGGAAGSGPGPWLEPSLSTTTVRAALAAAALARGAGPAEADGATPGPAYDPEGAEARESPEGGRRRPRGSCSGGGCAPTTRARRRAFWLAVLHGAADVAVILFAGWVLWGALGTSLADPVTAGAVRGVCASAGFSCDGDLPPFALAALHDWARAQLGTWAAMLAFGAMLPAACSLCASVAENA